MCVYPMRGTAKKSGQSDCFLLRVLLAFVLVWCFSHSSKSVLGTKMKIMSELFWNTLRPADFAMPLFRSL